MKKFFSLLLLLSWTMFVSPTAVAEILLHLSDEDEFVAPRTEPVQTPTPASKDGGITYRVICPPGGEVLPDCDKPVKDVETAVKPLPQPIQQKVESPKLDAHPAAAALPPKSIDANQTAPLQEPTASNKAVKNTPKTTQSSVKKKSAKNTKKMKRSSSKKKSAKSTNKTKHASSKKKSTKSKTKAKRSSSKK